MGRPGPVASQILIDRLELPMTVAELLEVTGKIQAERFPHCQPMPGAVKLVNHLHASGVPFAVRSNAALSSMSY